MTSLFTFKDSCAAVTLYLVVLLVNPTWISLGLMWVSVIILGGFLLEFSDLWTWSWGQGSLMIFSTWGSNFILSLLEL